MIKQAVVLASDTFGNKHPKMLTLIDYGFIAETPNHGVDETRNAPAVKASGINDVSEVQTHMPSSTNETFWNDGKLPQLSSKSAEVVAAREDDPARQKDPKHGLIFVDIYLFFLDELL